MVYTIQLINSLKNHYNDKIRELDDFVKMYQTLVAGNETIKNYRYDIIDKNGSGKRRSKITLGGNDIDKIHKSVKIILNKITDKNANVLIESLICEINKVYDFNILAILTNEILDKIIFEKTYQDIYINLCYRLWSLKKWQEKLVSIFINDNEQYFWYLNQQGSNISVETQMNGPFQNETAAYQAAWKCNNFRRTFMNELQSRFNGITKYIDLCKEETDDELRFKYRRHIFGIVELTGKLFNKKYIPENIIHVVLLKLLDKENRTDEYIECFCVLWNIVDDGYKPFDVKLIHEYFNYVEQNILKEKWIMRLQFMLEDLIDKYRKKYKVHVAANTASTTASTNVNGGDGDKGGKYVIRRKRVNENLGKLDEILDTFRNRNNLIETINKIKIIGVDKNTFIERINAKGIDANSVGKLLVGLDWTPNTSNN